MKRRPFLLVLLLGFALVGVAAAGVVLEGYRTLSASPGSIRGAAIDGDDSVDWATPIDTAGADRTIYPTHGDPTCAVAPRFSVDGGSCQVKVGLYRYNGATYDLMGVADVTTVTAGEQVDGANWMPDRPVFVDLSGATHYEVRVSDPTPAGATVTVRAWTFGAASKRAE